MTQRNYSGQNSLLGKGIALSQLPTIHEALEGNLPLRLVISHTHFPYDTYQSMALKPIFKSFIHSIISVLAEKSGSFFAIL